MNLRVFDHRSRLVRFPASAGAGTRSVSGNRAASGRSGPSLPGSRCCSSSTRPTNFIVGGGYFYHFSRIPVSLAWEAFGEKNGAASLPEMRARIERYRRVEPRPKEDYTIGCIILVDPFFLEERDWVPVPGDFSRQVQQGKNYDMTVEPGRSLWRSVGRASAARDAVSDDAPVEWNESVALRRLGQGAFRVRVTDAYERRCSITREKALPALEAAHIRPVTAGGSHALSNGVLLRRDVHALFDRGYLSLDTHGTLLVSNALRSDFHDGEYYTTLAGERAWFPAGAGEAPSKELLEWHADVVFKG